MIAKIYRVPNSAGDGFYDVDPAAPYCTCPSFEYRGGECKHVLAVRAKPNRYQLAGDESVTVGPGLFTIGHSNHSLETFLWLLNKHSIAIVVDVRSSPLSWFPRFERARLRESLAGQGIDYLWWGKELGGRTNISTQDPEFRQRMAGALRGASKHRLSLMCSEGKPERCHRAWKLAAFVSRLAVGRVPVTHILLDGTTVDSIALEEQQPQEWLWHQFGGKGGA